MSRAVHLVLGRSDDACCAGVLGKFLERGLLARLVANPLAPPMRLVWSLDDAGVQSRFAPDGVDPETVCSVLVRVAGWVDPDGWNPDDHAYMQSETRAALLAWLASLSCPVVNRASAALWYRPRMPLIAWRPLLRRAGLRTPEFAFTNDAVHARSFGADLHRDGVDGAVCTLLTADAAWLVTESGWSHVAAFQQRAPVCLVEPHGRARCACVVGSAVVWDGAPRCDDDALAAGLLRFAKAAGLAFVEMAIAPVRGGPAVVHVDPLVQLDHFDAPARERIVDALVALLAGEPNRAQHDRESLR